MFVIGKFYADVKSGLTIKINSIDVEKDSISITAKDKDKYIYNCDCRLSFDLSRFAWVVRVPVAPWRAFVNVSERQIVPGSSDLF